MKKPSLTEEIRYEIGMLDLLAYVEEKVKGFKDLMWDYICERNYIVNDMILEYYFFNLDFKYDNLDSEVEEILKKGIEVMKEEYPEMENHRTYFIISW